MQDAAQDEGPIGGLAAVLSQAIHQKVLVLAVDMPAMTSDFFNKVLCMMERRSGIVPQIGERYEPLCAIYPCDALSIVISFTETNRIKQDQAGSEQGLVMPLEIAAWPEILSTGTDSIRPRVRGLFSRNCISAVGVDATKV